MKGIQNTSTDNFGELIANGKKYIVPRFQRDYSWDTEQWDDLWQDILSMFNESSDHYMGYLVLQISNDKKFFIIDGQQRFTTITLIILAAIKAIKALIGKGIDSEENEKRIQSLTETYIGHVDPVSLAYDNTLVLNRNNDGYYREYIVKLGELRSRNLSVTEKLMKKCFEWYEEKLNGKFRTGREYADFIVKMCDNLCFTTITVNDEMNAFRVFETLNARGVQLSSSDLLKNYFFSLVDNNSSHKGRIETLDSEWSRLTDNIRSEKLPEFMRYYWNSKHKTVRASELFKAIRTNIKDEKQVFAVINDMLEYSDTYMALRDCNDDLWDNDKDISVNIQLMNVFNLKQPYSLLMAAKKNLSIDDFKRILKDIIVICFRYNVISGRNPNEIERSFNDIAINISNSKEIDYSKFLKIYVDDTSFCNSFATKDFSTSSRNTKVIRYILGKIENFKNGKQIIYIDDEQNSIEHILPQHPGTDWDIEENKVDRLNIRLGNMCLLERSLNINIGNDSFEEKTKIYENSQFQTTKNIAVRYSSWNESNIISRQTAMANCAKSIWKIDF